MPCPVVILGLGFTTQRLARRLRQHGEEVFAAVRDANRFAEFKALGVRLCDFEADHMPPGAVLVHSIPPLAEPENAAIRKFDSGNSAASDSVHFLDWRLRRARPGFSGHSGGTER